MENRFVNPHDCQYIQSRVALDADTVQQYADMLRQEIVFDACKGVINPVTGVIIVYDGNHRAEAAKREGVFVEVELEEGNAAYAEWLATGANTHHGLKRTPADIEHAVTTALRHPRAIGKSDREIARHCGCDHKTVGKYRKELEASGERPQMPAITVTRNGTDYQMTIPMPPKSEPEPVPDIDDTWDCPACGTLSGVRVKGYLQGPITTYDIRCQHCHKSWREPILYQRDAYYAAQKKITSQTPTSETVPGINAQGNPIQRPVIEARCIDCGEPFPRPEDRPDLQLCYECGQARLQERERLTEVHQQHGLIPTSDDDDIEICDFCGKEFPEDALFHDNNPKTVADFYICLSCAQNAVQQLSVDHPEPTFIEDTTHGLPIVTFREYNPEQECVPGSEEWWFTRTDLTPWDMFQQYQYFRKHSGDAKSREYALDAQIRALKLEIEDLKKKRDTAVECYQKLRNGTDAAN
jgi:hypothetical protein